MIPSTATVDSASDHPSAEALCAFANGLADSDQSTWIEEHVAKCDTCASNLENAPGDGLVELLRTPRRDGLSPSDPLWPSKTFQGKRQTASGFQMLEPLGRGGMGIVYLAWQPSLQRHVALKMMARGGLAQPEDIRRFQREAEAAASLKHENIVQVYEVGELDGSPYIAMELVKGCTLSKYLAGGPMPVDSAVQLSIQIARAIQHAHSKSIIHRDLKPSNILLEGCYLYEESNTNRDSKNDLHPKIVDFGLAKRVGQLDNATLTGDLIGTPSYMSPEQAFGDTQAIGVGSDIYSLGAILYEALVGRPPFQGSGPLETVEQVRSQEPVRPTSLRAGIPRDVETICLKCLEKLPAQRYARATDLLEDLLRFQGGLPIAARQTGWMMRATKWAKRRPTLAALVATLALCAAGWLATEIVHNHSMRLALEGTQQEKARANTNFQFAIRSIEQMLDRVGFDQMMDRPAMEEVRADLLTDAVNFYSELLSTQPESDVDSKRLYYRALSRQGSILRTLGRNDAARESLRQAIDLQSHLLKEYPKDSELQHELAVSHTNYGLVDHNADSFRSAIELLSEIQSTLPICRRDLAQAMSNLGTATSTMDEQESHHLNALQLRQELLAEAPEDSQLQFGLAQTYYNLGLLYIRTHRLHAGAETMVKAIGIFEKLVERRGSVSDYQFSLAECYASFAVMQQHLGQLDDAIQTSDKGINLRTVLAARFPKVPSLRQSLARSYMTHVSLLLPVNRFPDAMILSQKALDIAEELNRESASRDHRIFVAACLTILATSASGIPDISTSKSVFERATRLYDELLEEVPSDDYCLTEAGVNCMNFSNILRSEDPSTAMEYNNRSVEILEKLYSEDPKRQDYQLYLFNAHGARAQTLETLKRYPEAAKAWSRLVELSTLADRSQYELLEALALARAGATFEAAAIGHRLTAIQGLTGADLYNLACLFGILDAKEDGIKRDPTDPTEAPTSNSEMALNLLSQPSTLQFLQTDANRQQMLSDPDLETIRLHPGFLELCEKLNQ